MLELLAPAGDLQSFDTAIRCGADAVYLGMPNFNARMKAHNFDENNIASVVARAHFYGVKVYVTINTILQNQEFKPLIDMIKVCIDAGVDAFIVQDLGVGKLLKDCFDNIVLHASTQMGIHNLLGAKVAEKLGFSRVVLSRETKLEDIKAIKQNTSLEIEYFVQGALCIAFSGNCYLSSVEQGASGNRGLCKQLCRLPYDAYVNREKQSGYLLSARDLCLAPSLYELAKAGVDSFKIEGRLRRVGYVAQTVTTYRRLLDNVNIALTGAKSDIRFTPKDEKNLKIAFSRGEFLNRAYLDNGTPKIVEKRYQNHSGIEIGKVIQAKPFKQDLYEITLSTSYDLQKGDGLKFFDKTKEVASLGVGDVKKICDGKYSFVTKQNVAVGLKVHLISTIKQEEIATNCTRTLPIKMEIVANCGEPLKICATYKGIVVSKQSIDSLDKAISSPMSEDDIVKQCVKVGDSGFDVENITVTTNGVFIAKSIINALRRDVLDDLKERIIKSNSPKRVIVNESKIAKYLEMIDNAHKVTSINLSIESEKSIYSSNITNGKVVLRLTKYTIDEIRNLCSLLGVDESEVALELPIIANGKDTEIIQSLLKGSRINTLVSNNLYGLHFVDKYNVIAGQGHNIANVIAINALKELGANGYIPSLEYPSFLADDELARYSINKDIALMTFAHCPYKTLFDNDCNKCTFKGDITLVRNKNRYIVTRYSLSQCYFSLFDGANWQD